jgi:hypothetical protein
MEHVSPYLLLQKIPWFSFWPLPSVSLQRIAYCTIRRHGRLMKLWGDILYSRSMIYGHLPNPLSLYFQRSPENAKKLHFPGIFGPGHQINHVTHPHPFPTPPTPPQTIHYQVANAPLSSDPSLTSGHHLATVVWEPGIFGSIRYTTLKTPGT